MTNQEPEYRRRIRQRAEQEERAAEREHDEAAENTHVDKVVTPLERAVEKLDSQANESGAENKRERPWKRAEVIGLWAAAFVGVAAVCIGSRDANQQRKVMHDQLTTMQGQLNEMRSEQRPWMSISHASVVNDDGKADHNGLWYDGRTAHITLRLKIENAGHTPALNVDFALIATTIERQNWKEVQRRKCNALQGQIKNEPRNDYLALPAIMPGTYWEQDTDSGGPKPFLDMSPLDTIKEGTQFTPLLVGCIVYRLASDPLFYFRINGVAITLTDDPLHPKETFVPVPVIKGVFVPKTNLRVIRKYTIGEIN